MRVANPQIIGLYKIHEELTVFVSFVRHVCKLLISCLQDVLAKIAICVPTENIS